MSLLTATELRQYISDTSEADTTLTQRIADTEAELNGRFGALPGDDGNDVTETVYAYGMTLLPLKQEPDAITSVTDRQSLSAVDLDLVVDTDYRVRGRYLERVGNLWGNYTTVTYRPVDGSSPRRRVLVKLIQLDMNYAPGVSNQGGGTWNESYVSSYRDEREAIMATLGPGEELFA